MLDLKEAQRVFEYDPFTGKLHWRVDVGRRGRAGNEAGYPHTCGLTHYRQVQYARKAYLTHRVIWLLVYGTWPKEIDHVDGNGTNNRLCNLRLANNQNHHNCRKRKTNKSGFKGVYWHTQSSRWRSQIVLNYKQIHLGNFKTPEAAHAAYCAAADKYHGEFANYG